MEFILKFLPVILSKFLLALTKKLFFGTSWNSFWFFLFVGFLHMFLIISPEDISEKSEEVLSRITAGFCAEIPP